MTITPKTKLRITVAACAMVIPLFLSACRRDHDASSSPPVNTNDMGWFSAIHAAQPNSRVDAGWWLLVSRGQDGSLIWSVNNRKTDEPRLRELLAKMRDIGFDGVLLDADDDVPVSFIKKTLDILHEYNQRHVVLFRRIEGVESEFFQEISEGMLTNLIEVGEASPATKAVSFGSSQVKAAHD